MKRMKPVGEVGGSSRYYEVCVLSSSVYGMLLPPRPTGKTMWLRKSDTLKVGKFSENKNGCVLSDGTHMKIINLYTYEVTSVET